MNKMILIVLAVALVAGAAWFFFFRKKSPEQTVSKPWVGESAGSSGVAVRSVAAPYLPPSQVPLALPANTQPSPPSSFSVRQGVELAATAGCVAYSGGSLAPLCGVAAPLAVAGAYKAGGAIVGAGKSIVGGIKSLF